MIDHVRARNGLVYWSHLEEDERMRFLTARLKYVPRPEMLVRSEGYTGFGCFPQGYRASCQPGGPWDQRLARSILNKTYDGPWVIGEADYHGDERDEPYRNICNPSTVFELQELNASGVLDALRHGRMYAYAGSRFQDSVLSEFHLSSADGHACARSGEVLPVESEPTLYIRIRGFRDGCFIRVICHGVVFVEKVTHQLRTALPVPQTDGYACRAEAFSPSGEHLVTNPVFVLPLRPSAAAPTGT